MSVELAALACCDLGGIVRGRFVPAAELDRHRAHGVGWVPANLALTPFDELVAPNPFGSVGDLRLVARDGGEVRAPFGEGTPYHVVLGNLESVGGDPWAGCPRTLLAQTVARVERELGGVLRVAFEHEFTVRAADPHAAAAHPHGAAADPHGAAPHPAFSISAVRALDPFASELFALLADGGLEPELLLAEYGPGQLEVPCRPCGALDAADRAVHVRELARELARRRGRRATFAPLLEPDGPTSGVHIHVCLDGAEGGGFHDATAPGGLSALGGAFAAGILQHAPALVALTASSVVSPLRLRPGRWSAGRRGLGLADRECVLRIPGHGSPAAHRLEYRAADATASPHLALAALLIAGSLGVEAGLPTPPLDAAGDDALPLPATLAEALDALEADDALTQRLPQLLLTTFLLVKRAEIAALEPLDPRARCARYADVY